MTKERLQKVLAQSGVASRRASERLILAGQVEVNGEIVRTLGVKVDPAKDVIKVKGELVRPSERKVYYLLHKPKGVVSTCHDPRGRPTVLDFLPRIRERVYPVGRLDFDSEGLVFLTNDGDVALVFTHPRYQVEKRYLVEVQGLPNLRTIGRLQSGVRLADGLTAPARVRLLKELPNSSILEFGIHEGKNRQIRRMCEAVGHPVVYLKRFQMGPLDLEGVPLGEYRRLRSAEVRELRAFAAQARVAVKTR
ncbi:MAG: rRNA pseudouridine synthase [Firmicutes bacterium]|nr:rRNA pseudouridine synthase [Bacillota bacterium]